MPYIYLSILPFCPISYIQFPSFLSVLFRILIFPSFLSYSVFSSFLLVLCHIFIFSSFLFYSIYSSFLSSFTIPYINHSFLPVLFHFPTFLPFLFHIFIFPSCPIPYIHHSLLFIFPFFLIYPSCPISSFLSSISCVLSLHSSINLLSINLTKVLQFKAECSEVNIYSPCTSAPYTQPADIYILTTLR